MDHEPITGEQVNTMQSILKTQFYTYKDKPYKVVRIIKSKCPYYGHWFLSVEYRALYEIEVTGWVGNHSRHIDEFLTKFKPTEVVDEKNKRS